MELRRCKQSFKLFTVAPKPFSRDSPWNDGPQQRGLLAPFQMKRKDKGNNNNGLNVTSPTNNKTATKTSVTVRMILPVFEDPGL